MRIPLEVKDAARAVARREEFATLDTLDSVNIDGEDWMGLDMNMSLARNLGLMWSKANGPGSYKSITAREVRGMMVGLGAGAGALAHARTVATLIRSRPPL